MVWCLAISLSAFSQTLTRGPYLQLGTSSSMQVRWKTSSMTETQLWLGSSPTSLNLYENNLTSDSLHTVNITGLNPNTTYYYALGYGNNQVFTDTAFHFTTQPTAGSTPEMRFWVTGDCGSGLSYQISVAEKMEQYLNGKKLNGWLLLGDNAYSYGYDIEYQTKFFEPYQNFNTIHQVPIYPSPGNHDYAGNATRRIDHNIPYYDIFDMFTNAEMGGVASGTEHYYSYNIGNVHFVSIDSYGRDGSYLTLLADTVNSPQVEWLKLDLAANTQPWTILYWHHPPYSMGSHNTDTEADLVAIRENIVPILDQYHVDLVINGHSHSYERSRPIKNQLGLETTFDANIHNMSHSSGKADGSPNSCPYIRSSEAAGEGIVYMVAGSAGRISGKQAAWPHDAMYYSSTLAGSVLLTVHGDTLKSEWITENGDVLDNFQMIKRNSLDSTVNVAPGQSVVLTSPQKTSYLWPATGESTQSITINQLNNGQYFTVSDAEGCFIDKFKIVSTPDCIATKNFTYTLEAPSDVALQAAQLIQSTGKINDHAKMIFQAGSAIELNAGFEVKSGGVFETSIQGCP